MRNRARSLADKPTGTGPIGRECESTAGGVEVRPLRAAISASGPSDTNGRCPALVREPCAALEGTETSSMESENINLRRLRRRCTKRAIAITETMAATPPTTPPTIAGVFDFVCDDDSSFVTVPLGFMLRTGTLREGPSQSSKIGGIALDQL